jgi:DNA-binding SARP family transcriptional activator
MAAPRFEFRILGPLEVWKDGVAVNVGGPRQRLLLGLLLLGANRVVSRDRLLEELGDGRRSDADRMLRVQASRLRKALATDGDEPRVVARPPGYLFRVEPGRSTLPSSSGCAWTLAVR